MLRALLSNIYLAQISYPDCSSWSSGKTRSMWPTKRDRFRMDVLFLFVDVQLFFPVACLSLVGKETTNNNIWNVASKFEFRRPFLSSHLSWGVVHCDLAFFIDRQFCKPLSCSIIRCHAYLTVLFMHSTDPTRSKFPPMICFACLARVWLIILI